MMVAQLAIVGGVVSGAIVYLTQGGLGCGNGGPISTRSTPRLPGGRCESR